jgi:ATP-dependent phosphofructokinase / diphosphate-dependent phosphofructokinase
VPKTIDNDYAGIDFTFGYFTAVETLAHEILNLLADAEANRSYFLVESMGRSAGWLAYGAAIAGEASFVFSVEDLTDLMMTEETITDAKTGNKSTRKAMIVEMLVDKIVRAMIAREREGKEFGVIVIAEGLGQYLPAKYLEGVTVDEHGHIALAQTNLAQNMTKLVGAEYEKRQGKKRRLTPVTLGYESRCAVPHAFDVVLGSQLGVGAYRALVENHRNGVLISVSGQLDLKYVPFDDLIDPATLVTVVRRIEPGSDFQKLARFLEEYAHN